MAELPDTVARPRRTQELFRQLSWWRPPFIVDYLVLVAVAVASYYAQFQAPFEHDVAGRLNDPSIAYRHTYKETVPVVELWTLSFDLPLAVIVILGLLRYNLAEVHSGVLAYMMGWHLQNTFVGFVKNHVGRLRPDFLDRCRFDIVEGVCTGNPILVREGRRSFPSGHSACSFYASVFLVLLLAGKTRSLCFSSQGAVERAGDGRTRLDRWSKLPAMQLLQSKVLRLTYTLAPLLLGAYVAISRFEDHWHHPTDIAIGSLLGSLFAMLSYHVFWPSPFVPSNIAWMSQPRALYVNADEAKSATAEAGERRPLLGDGNV